MTVIATTAAHARIREQLDDRARTSGDLDRFVADVKAAVGRIIPSAAIALGTLDPDTVVPSGGCFAPVDGASAEEIAAGARRFAELEYHDPEPSSLIAMHRRGVVALGMALETGGRVERSRRMRELYLPLGITDEARMLGYAGGRPWAAVMLFRASGTFTADEVAVLGSLSSAVGRGVRAGILQQAYGRGHPEAGGRSLVVDHRGRIVLATAAARDWLARLTSENGSPAAAAVVPGLVARLAVDPTGVSQARVRMRDGDWFTVSAERLLGPDGCGAGQMVITVVRSDPTDLSAMLFESLGLTPREQAVTRLVMDGLDTRRIAGALGLSAYTVQDHLKSVFGKAGVASRGQLVARIEGRA